MNLQVLGAIHQFLQRVELRGNEVPTFNLCVEAIESEARKLQAPETGAPTAPEVVDAE